MEVKCNTKDYLDLSELTEFQGGLKERDDKDYAKIEKSIKQYGFAFPFFVWKHDGVNHVLDGHGRYGALSRMGITTLNFWRVVNQMEIFMRKIKSVLMAAFACVLFFGCSLDGKFKNTEDGKFKNTEWSGSIPYGIYNEETEKFDYYKAEVTLSLDSDLNGIFEIKVEKEVHDFQNERLEVCGVLKEVMNESEGCYENWLICNYGENNLEFLIKEYQTPAPTQYVLEMTNHPIYAFATLKEKNNYCWIR